MLLRIVNGKIITYSDQEPSQTDVFSCPTIFKAEYIEQAVIPELQWHTIGLSKSTLFSLKSFSSSSLDLNVYSSVQSKFEGMLIAP